MKPLDPFPLWVKHHPEESAEDLFARTLTRNGIASSFAWWQAVGSRERGYGCSIEAVARLCSADVDALVRATPRREGTAITLYGHQFGLREFSQRHVWCTDCLEEAPVRRAWWSVRVLQRCPRHDRPFSTKCSCRDWPKVRISGDMRCSCGAALADAPPGRIQVDARDFEDHVFAVLMGEPCAVPLLSGMPLADQIELIRMLGRVRDGGVDLPDVDGRLAAAEGFGIASHFPGAFWASLDQSVQSFQRTDAKRSYGAYGVYGADLLQWISSHIEAPAVAAIAEELRQHAAQHVILREGFRLLGRTVDRRHLSLVHAAAECGISPERMRDIALARGMVREERMPGVPLQIRPEDVAEIRLDLERYATSSQMATLLGLDHDDVLTLAGKGVIVSATPPAELRPEGAATMFLRTEATSLIERMLQGRKIAFGVPEETFDLPEAARCISMPTVEVIERVLADQIRITAIDPKRFGIRSLRVDPRGWKSRIRREETILLTARDIADRHSIHEQVARELIAHGALPTSRHNSSVFVHETAVDGFFEAHMTPSQAAEMLGVSAKRVVYLLPERGVEPVWGPPDVRQRFYAAAAVRMLIR